MTTAKFTLKSLFQPISFRAVQDDSILGRHECFTFSDAILADSDGECLLDINYDSKGKLTLYANHLCELISENCKDIKQIDEFLESWNSKTQKQRRCLLESIDKEYEYKLVDDRNRGELAIFKTHSEALAAWESSKDTHRWTGLRIEKR